MKTIKITNENVLKIEVKEKKLHNRHKMRFGNNLHVRNSVNIIKAIQISTYSKKKNKLMSIGAKARVKAGDS